PGIERPVERAGAWPDVRAADALEVEPHGAAVGGVETERRLPIADDGQPGVQILGRELDEPQPAVERRVPGNVAKGAEGDGPQASATRQRDGRVHERAPHAAALAVMADSELPQVKGVLAGLAGGKADQRSVPVLGDKHQAIALERDVELGRADVVLGDGVLTGTAEGLCGRSLDQRKLGEFVRAGRAYFDGSG